MHRVTRSRSDPEIAEERQPGGAGEGRGGERTSQRLCRDRPPDETQTALVRWREIEPVFGVWKRYGDGSTKIKSSAAAGGFWTCFFNGFQRQTASLRSQTEANPGGKARKGGRLQRVQRFRHFGGGVPLVLQLGQEATTDGTQSFSGSIKPIYISSTTPKQPPPPPQKKKPRGTALSLASGTSVFVEPVVLVTNFSENQKL